MQTDIMVLEEEIKKIETERDATFTLLEQGIYNLFLNSRKNFHIFLM